MSIYARGVNGSWIRAIRGCHDKPPSLHPAPSASCAIGSTTGHRTGAELSIRAGTTGHYHGLAEQTCDVSGERTDIRRHHREVVAIQRQPDDEMLSWLWNGAEAKVQNMTMQPLDSKQFVVEVQDQGFMAFASLRQIRNGKHVPYYFTTYLPGFYAQATGRNVQAALNHLSELVKADMKHTLPDSEPVVVPVPRPVMWRPER